MRVLAWRRVGVLVLGRRRVTALAWWWVAVVAVGRVGRVAGRRVGVRLCVRDRSFVSTWGRGEGGRRSSESGEGEEERT